MTLKSNEQLNNESPELRDVVILIDGLGVLDINLAPGARATQYSIQLSGDMGLNPNGHRAVYGHAAQVLNTILDKGFSAHANVSRDDLDNDVFRATELVKQAIDALTKEGKDVFVHCHSLAISVYSTDFDLIPSNYVLGVLEGNETEAADKIEFLLEPSEALTKQMTGERKNLVREDLGESTPATTSLGTTTTIMINDELHVRRDFTDGNGEAVIVWVPSELNESISGWGDISQDNLSFHGNASGSHPTYILNRHAVKGNSDQSPV